MTNWIHRAKFKWDPRQPIILPWRYKMLQRPVSREEERRSNKLSTTRGSEDCKETMQREKFSNRLIQAETATLQEVISGTTRICTWQRIKLLLKKLVKGWILWQVSKKAWRLKAMTIPVWMQRIEECHFCLSSSFRRASWRALILFEKLSVILKWNLLDCLRKIEQIFVS